MNDRTRKVTLPGTIAFAISTVFMYVGVVFHALHLSQVHWLNPFGFFTISWLSVCGSLASGAAGAYLSLRLGGSRKQRTLSALFPAIIMAAMMGFSFVVGLIWRVFGHPVSLFIMGSSLLGYLIGTVLIPAACLTAGALPFLFQREEEVRGLAE